MKGIEEYIDSNTKVLKPSLIFSDPVMKLLSKGFDEAAMRILKAIFLHRPIILRHHNDTDGICSGLAIYLAISTAKNVRVITNKYPAYRMVEAEQDANRFHQSDAEYLSPLLIVCDVGSSVESFDSYDYVKKEGFEIIIIDHHPPSPGVEKHVDLIVSPYLVPGGGTSYTTGLLASEVSQRIAKVELHDLSFIAMVGDRSMLEFEKKDRYLKYAIALDYLVSMKDPSIEEIARNFLDKEAMETNYMLAMERIDTVKGSLMRKVKTKNFTDVSVFLISTDKEFANGHFPSRGMMANIVSDEMALSLKTPAITISHGKRNINMRFNKPALEEGWSGAELVKQIREELPNAMESGGGHPGAASIRINRGFTKIILDQLLKDIEEQSEDII